MTFTDWDGKKYLVKVKSYDIFKTISAADTEYHYLCSDLGFTIILYLYPLYKILKVEY